MVLEPNIRKELCHRGFVENAHAQNLEDFEETRFALDLLSHDRDQCINTHRNPELGSHRVLRASVETFDSQVLLDPLKEQFHAPTLLVQLRSAERSARSDWSKKPDFGIWCCRRNGLVAIYRDIFWQRRNR